MAAGIFVDFDTSHHAAVVLLVLGAILVLPLVRMPLLKLYCQRATSVLPSCVCYLADLTHISAVKGNCASINFFGQPPASRA